MTIQLRHNWFYDEYIYKYLYAILGVLYWVYGFTKYINILLNCLMILSLVPILHNYINRKNYCSFHLIVGILIGVFGVCTVLFCNSKSSTAAAVLRSLVKVMILAYVNVNKTRDVLLQEIYSICRITIIIGTIVLGISLITYLMGLSVPYYINSRDDKSTLTVLYIGRSARNSLCGILANPNMVSNFCVVYLGSLFLLSYKTNRKLITGALVCLDLLVLFFTSSRGGIIGAIIFLFFISWGKIRNRLILNNTNTLLIIIVCTLLIIATLFFVLHGGTDSVSKLIGRTQDNLDNSTKSRFVLWGTSLKISFMDVKNFMFGIGFKIDVAMKEHALAPLPEVLYTNTHNYYLQIGLRYGIPFALLIVSFIVYSLKPFRKKKYLDLKTNSLLFALAGVVFSLLVINLFESDMDGKGLEGLFVWIFMGYISPLVKTYLIIERKPDNVYKNY